MSTPWRNELQRIAGLLLTGMLVGAIVGHIELGLLISITAYLCWQLYKAVKVWSEDRLVDREHESLNSIPVIVKAMFVTRAIERIGDRVSNICEYIIYLVKGKDVRHTRLDQLVDD